MEEAFCALIWRRPPKPQRVCLLIIPAFSEKITD
jgi:hypothetical protein